VVDRAVGERLNGQELGPNSGVLAGHASTPLLCVHVMIAG